MDSKKAATEGAEDQFPLKPHVSSCSIAPKKPAFDETGRIRLTRMTSKGG